MVASLGRNVPRFAAGFGLLAVIALFVACVSISLDDDDNGDSVTPSGKVVTESYDFAGFTGVDLSHAFAATITRSDSFLVEVSIDDNLLEHVLVEADGQELRVRLDRGLNIGGSPTLRVTVTMPSLGSLQLSGASSATLSGFDAEASVAIRASGASRASGSLTAEALVVDLSGASSVRLSGAAQEAELDASGASSLELGEYVLQSARVSLSGASTGEIVVEKELEAIDLSGASHLVYAGNPAVGSVDVSGASSLKER